MTKEMARKTSRADRDKTKHGDRQTGGGWMGVPERTLSILEALQMARFSNFSEPSI